MRMQILAQDSLECVVYGQVVRRFSTLNPSVDSFAPLNQQNNTECTKNKNLLKNTLNEQEEDNDKTESTEKQHWKTAQTKIRYASTNATRTVNGNKANNQYKIPESTQYLKQQLK